MSTIGHIQARQILDSKGNPTIETTVVLDDDSIGISSCPSGTSTGAYEAIELRDNDKHFFSGKGVLRAIGNIHDIIAPKLIGQDASNQKNIDDTMITLDGTENKKNLGANAILSVSIATCIASAKSTKIPLYQYIAKLAKNANQLTIPTPAFNLINGGLHAKNNLDFQEFLVLPFANNFSDALTIGVSVYKTLGHMLETQNKETLVGDEGGFGPQNVHNEDALLLLQEAILKNNLSLGVNVFFGIDAASGSFYSAKENSYTIKSKGSMTATNLALYYKVLNNMYHFCYLEDPFEEDDWEAWSNFTATTEKDTLIVGDDLTVTNEKRLQMAIDKKAITGIVIKPNQIGTISETLEVVSLAKQNNMQIIVSHRSGETNDDFIADFAVGVSADYVKFGAPARGERVAKYNRLLAIEQLLNNASSQKI